MTRTPPPIPNSRSDALARARALAPAISARAARAEAERRVPRDTIEDLRRSGLFGVSTLGFAAQMLTTAELGAACGSTGWVYAVFSGHNWIVSLFPEAAQREAPADALTASMFRLTATVEPVSGGYRVTGGEGRFCSGVAHADWLLAGVGIRRGEGPNEPRFVLLPMAEVEVVDDWFTVGMRGTGSCSIRVADAFVPEHRTLNVAAAVGGSSPAALFSIAAPMSLVGAPLGMARAALETFAANARAKLAAQPPGQAGEQGALFARIARAGAEIDAATALVLADCERLDALSDPAELDAATRARMMRNLAYAVQACRRAVTGLFEAAGGSGIYDTARLQRIWRDLNAAAAHMAFGWDEAGVKFARAYLGLPPSRFAVR